MFGAGAIYSITPVDEEIGRAAAGQLQERPVTVYIPARAAHADGLADEGDYEDEDGGY
jgi:hypothetical protein